MAPKGPAKENVVKLHGSGTAHKTEETESEDSHGKRNESPDARVAPKGPAKEDAEGLHGSSTEHKAEEIPEPECSETTSPECAADHRNCTKSPGREMAPKGPAKQNAEGQHKSNTAHKKTHPPKRVGTAEGSQEPPWQAELRQRLSPKAPLCYCSQDCHTRGGDQTTQTTRTRATRATTTLTNQTNQICPGPPPAAG